MASLADTLTLSDTVEGVSESRTVARQARVIARLIRQARNASEETVLDASPQQTRSQGPSQPKATRLMGVAQGGVLMLLLDAAEDAYRHRVRLHVVTHHSFRVILDLPAHRWV